MKKSFCLLLLLSFTFVICQAQYIRLALNLTRGATYYHVSTTSAAVTQTYKGQPSVTRSVITSKIAFKVLGLRDSLYDMEVKYESLTFKLFLPGGTDVTYNSDYADPENPASGILTALKSQPLSAVISKSGNLVSVKGIDAALDKIIGDYTGMDANQKAQIRSTLLQSFGEQAFRSNFDLGTAVYPTIRIKIGARWVTDTQLAGPILTNVHTVYDLRDTTDTYYHIHANAIISFPNKDLFSDNNGMMVRSNFGGNMITDIVADKVTGWIKQSTINQTISGTTEIKDSPQTPGGLLMPISTTSNITITGLH